MSASAAAAAAAAEGPKGGAAANSNGAATTPTGSRTRHAQAGAGSVTPVYPSAATVASASATTASSSAASSASVSGPSTLPANALEIWKQQQQQQASAGGAGAAAAAALGSSIPQNLLPKKRGRPKGSKNSKPRKKRPPPEIEWRSEDDRVLCLAARRAVHLKVKGVETAKADAATAEADLIKAQARVEAAKRKVGRAEEAVRAMSGRKADHLLLEPNDWNTKYVKLLNFRDDGGNVLRMSKGKIGDDIPEQDRKTYRSLTKWQAAQRTAKRQGKLEPYQEILLDRVRFCWNLPQGPDKGPGGKWHGHYNKLKQFKELHGHLDVPRDYPPDPKLYGWLKKQKSCRHAKMEGRYEGLLLTDEREGLLEELGVVWTEKRIIIPWEARFRELLQYRKDHGHCNVPWQWGGNRPLARWVNAQRKKYVDMERGKKSNLTPDQIRRLEEIGFRWSTEGKGRYTEPDATRPAKAQQQETNQPVTQLNESMEEAQALLVEFSQGDSAGKVTDIPGLGKISTNDFV
mmetsp:Transcript_36677/g.80185  ORF Transcript_36677/g.80185 Transcript_36677/m.80185 type:complete len:517 (-) Transcript_36677:198-1748(-)